jgi:hypothetical protein
VQRSNGGDLCGKLLSGGITPAEHDQPTEHPSTSPVMTATRLSTPIPHMARFYYSALAAHAENHRLC